MDRFVSKAHSPAFGIYKVERIAVEVFASLGVESAIPIMQKPIHFISITKSRIGVPGVWRFRLPAAGMGR
ncbi:MAG: hypothetical protein PHO16_09110 [Candidatus Cloacimonetes bacterium]|nr:hypothetical protein [Candidatus Cloacimonadota bacterium]